MTGRTDARVAFITGATGCIGTALTKRLSSLGWRVIALVRAEGRAAHLVSLPGVEILVGDLDERELISNAVRGCDVVFHLAAKVHAPTGTREAEFMRANVDGTRNVLDAATSNMVRRFVFLSTAAVYGEAEGVVTETTRPAPSTPYGASKLEAETLIMSRANEIGVTVLRLPIVYGPRDRGNFARLVRAIASGRFFIPGHGRNVKSMVAVQNVVDAALLVARDERAKGQVYLVADAHDYSLNEIVTAIADALGRSARFPRLPVGAATAIGGIADAIGGVARLRLPISADSVRKLAANTRCSSEKIRSELGFAPTVSLREGLAEVVREIAP